MCNCNKSTNIIGKISSVKTRIKKLWENTQFEEKSVIIKKINK
jgi:hypothetical protein